MYIYVVCKNYKESTVIKFKVLKKGYKLFQVWKSGRANNLITENNRANINIFEYIRARHNNTVKQMGYTEKLHAIKGRE